MKGEPLNILHITYFMKIKWKRPYDGKLHVLTPGKNVFFGSFRPCRCFSLPLA